MAKGGARPGAGRKKGQKDVRPRKGTEAQQEADQIRQLLSLGIKAKAKFYQEFLFRVANADKKQKPLSIVEKRMMDKLAEDLAEKIADGAASDEVPENLDPLSYMLKVMNDPTEKDTARKDRMAMAAAPFCHPRKGESGTGKKEEQADRAKTAGKGRFAPSRPPVALVK